MLTLHPTTKFRKDYKRAKSRNLDMQELEKVIQTLLEEKLILVAARTGSHADFGW
jgi:mRNA-degrading endonuclease YafQ of YafQ-DinJ toxin-antitoxin module